MDFGSLSYARVLTRPSLELRNVPIVAQVIWRLNW